MSDKDMLNKCGDLGHSLGDMGEYMVSIDLSSNYGLRSK